MRSILRFNIGPLIYISSIVASFLTIELLRRIGGKEIFAEQYIEWTAVVIVIAAIADYGIPSGLQWGILSTKTQLRPNNFRQGLITYVKWIKWCIKGQDFFIRSLFILIGSAIFITFFLPKNPILGDIIGCVAIFLVCISINIRKTVCAFLEGAHRFILSRVIYSAPNFLILIHITLLWSGTVTEVSFSDMVISIAGYYLAASVLGIALLASPKTYLQIPNIDHSLKIASSSKNWHLLSIFSVIHGQTFYLLAPWFGVGDKMIAVFYAQKAVQVSAEFAGQFTKEWFASERKISNDWSKRSWQTIHGVCLIPALFGVLGICYATRSISISSLPLVGLVFLEAYLSSVYTCKGYIALMSGQLAPLTKFISGSIMQSILSLMLIPIFGASGFYISSLIAGYCYSFRANQYIYKQSIYEQKIRSSH